MHALLCNMPIHDMHIGWSLSQNLMLKSYTSKESIPYVQMA
jgi:hypothetical protein